MARRGPRFEFPPPGRTCELQRHSKAVLMDKGRGWGAWVSGRAVGHGWGKGLLQGATVVLNAIRARNVSSVHGVWAGLLQDIQALHDNPEDCVPKGDMVATAQREHLSHSVAQRHGGNH